MKQTVFAVISLFMLAGCGSNDSKKESSTTNKEESGETKADDITKNPDYQSGLALVAKYKCLTCHNVDERITGPSYREVANRYAERPDTIVPHLAGKIIKGGNGQWGEVFMTPNAVKQEEAEAMVRYILLLKK